MNCLTCRWTAGLVLALGLVAVSVGFATKTTEAPASVPFDSAFDRYWGDGKAELAGYDLTIPRYGQVRKGTAVTITVTEPFSNSVRVKADDGRHPASDVFPALKLNLVEDFQTGVYDYNLMTSVFVGMKPVNGRDAGAVTKVSFGSQEWCGHVYAQALFDAGRVRMTSHSYFDGEADEEKKLDGPRDGISEDGVMLWARGLSSPFMKAGEEKKVPVLRSLKGARLLHKPLEWDIGTLKQLDKTETVRVPAGTFDAEVRTATVFGRTWTFYIEREHPNRLLKWTTSDGEIGDLIKSDRLTYWALHGEGDEKELERIGLKRRGERMP